MPNVFLTADLHLAHRKAAEDFTRDDGSKLRPFGTLEETDRAIIAGINSRVMWNDTLFILGDIAWTAKGGELLKQITCENLIAVLGNHDRHGLMDLSIFKEVHGAYPMKDIGVLTHIPVHPDCLGKRFPLNVHGHLHSGEILDENGNPDPRYMCVSVERNNFYPFHIDEVMARRSACAV